VISEIRVIRGCVSKFCAFCLSPLSTELTKWADGFCAFCLNHPSRHGCRYSDQ
jgi:hypothetical protein